MFWVENSSEEGIALVLFSNYFSGKEALICMITILFIIIHLDQARTITRCCIIAACLVRKIKRGKLVCSKVVIGRSIVVDRVQHTGSKGVLGDQNLGT